jgi:hypothetical protein
MGITKQSRKTVTTLMDRLVPGRFGGAAQLHAPQDIQLAP